MNVNNSIIYFLFGIIILSIIILIILIFESESDLNETNESSEPNLSEPNESSEPNLSEPNINSKSSCPIHNPKILQIGLGTVGLSSILILSNKYFNIKSGGKSKSIIKKEKIKKLIYGSNDNSDNLNKINSNNLNNFKEQINNEQNNIKSELDSKYSLKINDEIYKSLLYNYYNFINKNLLNQDLLIKNINKLTSGADDIKNKLITAIETKPLSAHKKYIKILETDQFNNANISEIINFLPLYGITDNNNNIITDFIKYMLYKNNLNTDKDSKPQPSTSEISDKELFQLFIELQSTIIGSNGLNPLITEEAWPWPKEDIDFTQEYIDNSNIDFTQEDISNFITNRTNPQTIKAEKLFDIRSEPQPSKSRSQTSKPKTESQPEPQPSESTQQPEPQTSKPKTESSKSQRKSETQTSKPKTESSKSQRKSETQQTSQPSKPTQQPEPQTSETDTDNLFDSHITDNGDSAPPPDSLETNSQSSKTKPQSKISSSKTKTDNDKKINNINKSIDKQIKNENNSIYRLLYLYHKNKLILDEFNTIIDIINNYNKNIDIHNNKLNQLNQLNIDLQTKLNNNKQELSELQLKLQSNTTFDIKSYNDANNLKILSKTLNNLSDIYFDLFYNSILSINKNNVNSLTDNKNKYIKNIGNISLSLIGTTDESNSFKIFLNNIINKYLNNIINYKNSLKQDTNINIDDLHDNIQDIYILMIIINSLFEYNTTEIDTLVSKSSEMYIYNKLQKKEPFINNRIEKAFLLYNFKIYEESFIELLKNEKNLNELNELNKNFKIDTNNIIDIKSYQKNIHKLLKTQYDIITRLLQTNITEKNTILQLYQEKINDIISNSFLFNEKDKETLNKQLENKLDNDKIIFQFDTIMNQIKKKEEQESEYLKNETNLFTKLDKIITDFKLDDNNKKQTSEINETTLDNKINKFNRYITIFTDILKKKQDQETEYLKNENKLIEVLNTIIKNLNEIYPNNNLATQNPSDTTIDNKINIITNYLEELLKYKTDNDKKLNEIKNKINIINTEYTKDIKNINNDQNFLNEINKFPRNTDEIQVQYGVYQLITGMNINTIFAKYLSLYLNSKEFGYKLNENDLLYKYFKYHEEFNKSTNQKKIDSFENIIPDEYHNSLQSFINKVKTEYQYIFLKLFNDIFNEFNKFISEYIKFLVDIQTKTTELNNEQTTLKLTINELNTTITRLENEKTDLINKKQLNDIDYQVLEHFKNHINNIIKVEKSSLTNFNNTTFQSNDLPNTNEIIKELISTYNSKIITLLSTYQSQNNTLKLAIEDNEKSFKDFQNQIKNQNKDNNILFNFFNKIKNLFSTSKDSIKDPNESLDDYINKIYIFIEQEINKINQQLKELQNINNMQNEECKQKILELQQNIETLSNTNMELQNQIEQKNKQIEDLTLNNNNLNNQINLLNREYNKKIQELTNSNQQELNNKIKELTEINNQLTGLKNEKNQIIDKIKKSNLINEMEDNQIYNLPVIVDNLIVELTQNRKNISELSNLNTKLTKEHKLELEELTKEHIFELEELIKTHKLELENLNKAKEELNNKLTEEINKLKTERTNKNINILKYKTKIEILENAKIKLLTENKELKNKIVILEKQLKENNTKITELEKIIVEKEKYDKILNDQINTLIKENNKLTSEKEKSLSELKNELTILKDEISNENIQKETNINTLKNIIKNNTLLVITLNIKNKRLNEQIIKLQQENEEYKNKQLEIIKEKELNNIEFIKKYKELENKYNLNLNELRQITKIVDDYETKLSEELSKNELTLKEKEKLAIKIVQLNETNLLLNKNLIEQNNLIKQKEELLKQKEEMILNKLNEIEELKNRIKNININRLNDLKNKEQDLTNKEKELQILKQQHEDIIKQIKEENSKLELDLKKQIVELSTEKDTLNLSIQKLTTNLTTELDNLKKLQENKIQELTQTLLQLQTKNGTLNSTIQNLNKETQKLNKEIEECIANKNNTLLNEDIISNLTLQLKTCNNVKKDIYNLLTNKIAELEQSNNNNANKDAKIAELTSLLALNNLELIKKEEEKEKKIEELNKNQLELEKAHALAITNLTNEFNKIKEEINNENLQNNQKLILDLNKQCDNKIEQLENSITNLTKIGNESNLNIESKINEINKLKESYKIESEKLKKQNIVYYFKNLRLSTIIQNLNNNIEQLKNDNTTNINNLTDKENLITELQKELDRIKKILEDLEKEKKKMNSKYQNELDNCKKELDKCTNNLDKCTNNLNECSNNLNECTTNLNEYTTKLENCNNDRNSKENLIEQYKNKLGLQDNIIEQIQKDKQVLQERLNKLNTRLATTSNDEISKLSKENQKLIQENQDLQNQLNSLKTSTSTSTPTSTSTSITVSNPVSASSLPPIIDEYAYYSNHPYITKKSTKLIETIPDNDAYSKFIKKTRNELIV